MYAKLVPLLLTSAVLTACGGGGGGSHQENYQSLSLGNQTIENASVPTSPPTTVEARSDFLGDPDNTQTTPVPESVMAMERFLSNSSEQQANNNIDSLLSLRDTAISFTDGKISLNYPAVTLTRRGQENWAKVYSISGNEAALYFVDPADIYINGQKSTFQYQTLASVQRFYPNNGIEAFVIGDRNTTPITDTLNANYDGLAVGYARITRGINSFSQMTLPLNGTVHATVNINNGQGDMQLAVNMTTLRDVAGFPVSAWSFTEQLNYADGRFSGTTANADFFGADHSEIGGTFRRNMTSSTGSTAAYQGAFGAKINP